MLTELKCPPTCLPQHDGKSISKCKKVWERWETGPSLGTQLRLQPDGGAACRLNVCMVAMTTSLLDGATYYFFFFVSWIHTRKQLLIIFGDI